MKYLITGGCGFIGSNLIHLLQKKNPSAQILVIDRLDIGSDKENIPEGVDLRVADLEDFQLTKEIVNEFEPDFVIHAAAQSHVDRSISDPHSFVKSNVLGTLNLFESIAQNEKLVHTTQTVFVSTDEVYGELSPGDQPFVETLKHKPSSVYSASKSAGEALVHAYIKTHGMAISITNCSNNFGPRQYEEKFIPKTIRAILSGQPIIVYGDGTNIRDWVYVDDHNEALLQIVHGGVIGNNYNIGGHNEKTNLELIEDIKEIIYSPKITRYIKEYFNIELQPCSIDFVHDRKGHDFRYAVNTEKIEQCSNWKPDVEHYREKLQNTIKWYIDKFLKEGK